MCSWFLPWRQVPKVLAGRQLLQWRAATEEDLDKLRADPILTKTFEYWDEKRLGRPMPARRDIDPLELGPVLIRHVALIEIVHADGRFRFRFRLAGSEIDRAAGREMRGQFIDEINPDQKYAAYIEGLLKKVIEAKRPVMNSSEVHDGRRTFYQRTTRITCPLSSDGNTVDIFFTAQTFRSDKSEAPKMVNAPIYKTSDLIIL